ncbi:oogenesis-related [Sebastes umbrosus]|uniref:oogenesis-related n=1 Tax=Sebastes umbrosus TaxID=72105 RepID=UPI00189F0906|nr:oogenesis-related [Sebastes umbrosus]
MTCEIQRDSVELLEQPENTEEELVVRRGGVFWLFSLVVRTYRGFWWVLGYRQQEKAAAAVGPSSSSPARQSLAGRKRLHRVTRVLLSILPRWMQGALGYPVSSSIGRTLSPEIQVSPTKPCGKGSKRKQDELDEEDDEQNQTWVEALHQELVDDEGLEEDPNYEPSTIETESEEYRSHNSTESDIEVEEKGVVIEDVNTSVEMSSPSEVCSLAV